MEKSMENNGKLNLENMAKLEKEHEKIARDKKMYADTKKELYKPADYTDEGEIFDMVKKTILQYHPSDDLTLVENAYKLAKESHRDQKRKNGEPYITHPLNVALILAQLELDKETIAAGLLHDVAEDTYITIDDIRQKFGDEIALLVDGVTKLTNLNYSAEKIELQAENLRKMFLAMAKDIRVVIIKLADRLHNQRTMQYQKPEKAVAKSKETLEIYSPIAQRLGISKLKIELDDLALKYVEPDVYKDLSERLEQKLNEHRGFIDEVKSEIRECMEKAGIDATIDGRVKHIFSIYKKMVNKSKTLDQIYDLYAVRVFVETVTDCYAALGQIHSIYKPLPGRIKDYIAMPKPNMYQSLHTTVMGPNGQPFEVQIRTYEMHRVAEYGIAAHWKYKEAQNGKTPSASEEEKLTWLREILEWQNDMSNNKEFLAVLKNDLDLFSDTVFCFTPQGEVKSLPVGSTPIDFAYYIHSAVGNKMVGARVNGKQVPIEYKLQNGDRVEIVTSQNSKGPSRDWLSIVKSSQAKSKINQWFRSNLKEENIVKGKQMIVDYCKTKGVDPYELLKPEFMEPTQKRFGFDSWDGVLATVGHGGLKEGQIVGRLQTEYDKKHKREETDQEVLNKYSENSAATISASTKAKGSISITGSTGLAVHLSHCCRPIPGDEITGFVTRGRGISVHRTDCANVINLSDDERARLITIEWVPDMGDELYDAMLAIYAEDRSGIIVDVSKVLTEMKIDIGTMNATTIKDGKAKVIVGFKVNNKTMLSSIADKIRSIPGVIDIVRE
jgi:GTP pyrophosphokinase